MAGASASLLHVSENATFRVTPNAGPRAILRVCRPGYRTIAELRSELSFMTALSAETGVVTPRPLAGNDGDWVQRTPVGEALVLFEELPGAAPGIGGMTPELFRRAGAMAAHAHAFVHDWMPDAPIVRAQVVGDTADAPSDHWGDWREAPGVTEEFGEPIARAEQALRVVLASLPRTPETWGLIHADMHGDNLLADGDDVAVIDFDDCGYGWFFYDLAAALSFLEASPSAPQFRAAWLEGYCQVGPLPPDADRAVDAMVFQRRLSLLGWIGTHAGTPLACSHTDGFAAGTAMLAERFLGDYAD